MKSSGGKDGACARPGALTFKGPEKGEDCRRQRQEKLATEGGGDRQEGTLSGGH